MYFQHVDLFETNVHFRSLFCFEDEHKSITEGMNCAWKLFDVVFTVVFRTDKIEFMQSQVNPQSWDSNRRFFDCRSRLCLLRI